jgi:hypothetical protein
MVYQSINPSLVGTGYRECLPDGMQAGITSRFNGPDVNGYVFLNICLCKHALNVVSAVFTNDIYKGTYNPHASDKKLMQVARISSWMFGFGMIGYRFDGALYRRDR